MNYLKKYFTMIVSVVLIITSIVFAPFERSDILGGKGKGKSAKVTNVKELGEVFDFISNLNFEETEAKEINKLSTLAYSDQDEENTKKENKHSSVTFHNESVSSSKYSMKAPLGSDYHDRNFSMDFSRNLSVYMTKEGAYYKVTGEINYFDRYYNKKENGYVTEAYYLVFDIEIIIYKGGVLLKFNKWDVTGNFEYEFTNEIFGKWLHFSDYSIVEEFLDIDMTNREWFINMNDAIYDEIGADTLFVNKGSTYYVKEEFLKHFLDDVVFEESDLGEENIRNGEFTVDMSNPKVPSIYTWADCAINDETGIQKSTAYSYNDIHFENIDNTVIKMPDDGEIEFITDDNGDEFLKKYVIFTED